MRPRAKAPGVPPAEGVTAARREAGLSQRDLADRCGVSLWAVERLENSGESSEQLLRDVARALSIPPRQAVQDDSASEPWPFDGSSQPAEDDGSLGGRVALARAQAGLSQRELAQRLGTSLWDVQRLEDGDRRPAATSELARVLGGQPAWSAGAPTGEAGGQRDFSGPRNGAEPPAGQLATDAPARRFPDRLALGLVLGSFALLVTIRFLTEVVPVLPKAANFVDVPILAALAFAASFRGRRIGAEEATGRLALPAVLFLLIAVVSAVANLSRVQPGPVLVFIYGFLAPLVLFGSVYRLWPAGNALLLSRLIVALGLVQIAVVGLIDLPRFIQDQNPDDVSGTFGENPYQLVFFLLVFSAVVAGIYTFEKQRLVARFAPAIFLATLAIIFLAQYRALLVGTALVVVAIGALLGSFRFRGVLAGILVALAFFVSLSYLSQAFPVLGFDATVTTFSEQPTFYLAKRAEALADIAELYSDHPRYMLTGTGPGTYSSRAWQTFSKADSTSDSNVAGGYVLALTGGRTYQTDVSAQYVEPKLEEADIVEGSRAVSSPLSSYVATMAEVGLMGFALIVLVYVRAFALAARMTLSGLRAAAPRDPLPALLFGTAVAFGLLIQMGVLENWLEVTRLTFLAWGLLAIVSREFNARFPAASGETTV